LLLKPDSKDRYNHLNTVDTPLNQLAEKTLCPGNNNALEKINDSLR
jgi:2-oxoglutarate/2-oxoacid ferredoxin oxidoreductase subunit beta